MKLAKEYSQKVVILEDDTIMGKLMQSQVNAIEGYSCQHVFENPLDFLSNQIEMDILLLDVVMPEMNGIEAIDKILQSYPEVSIIMNTIKDDADTIFMALKKGASGYIDKQTLHLNFEEILKTVANGGAYMSPIIARKVFDSFHEVKNHFEQLTNREMEVTSCILDGKSYKMIAGEFNISLDTVRFFVKNIYKKLKINSKGELFKLAKK